MSKKLCTALSTVTEQLDSVTPIFVSVGMLSLNLTCEMPTNYRQQTQVHKSPLSDYLFPLYPKLYTSSYFKMLKKSFLSFFAKVIYRNKHPKKKNGDSPKGLSGKSYR